LKFFICNHDLPNTLRIHIDNVAISDEEVIVDNSIYMRYINNTCKFDVCEGMKSTLIVRCDRAVHLAFVEDWLRS
jgi:hypothetical protein